MALNKEEILAKLKQTWEQFQESSVYIKVRERYENLSPNAQKGVLIGLAISLTVAVLYPPLGSLSNSSTFIEQFEAKRDLIRELLKVYRESHDLPMIPIAPPIEALRNQIDGILKGAQLIPEQMRGIDNDVPANGASLVPSTLISGALKVALAKLNVRQIMEIGYQIQSISPSVKMKDLTLEANAQDPRYFDVTFRVITLNVPVEPPPVVEIEEPKKGKGSSRSVRPKSDSGKGDE